MPIDLISDTVTRPTPGMLKAMWGAEVGDDVFDEDAGAHVLQRHAADLFGHEAALFMPSGVMSNQVAIKAHTEAMDELICEETSHVFRYENGGYAFHSQIAIQTIPGDHGRLRAEQIAAAIKPPADWLPRSRLVVLENSCNAAGGSYYTLDRVRPIRALCAERGLRLHLDGARLFNALVASGESAREWGEQFDSISVCLSKGLGAPVGSLLLGSREFIARARRLRKGFGGGMRQIGFLCAAGLYALQHHVERLAEDHEHARLLAAELMQAPYVAGLRPVSTNIVIFDLAGDWTAAAFLARLAQQGIRGSAFGPRTVRFVTHLDVDRAMIGWVCAALRDIGRVP
ncbi:MAG: aminotransferase class I/II-fold pyridoxal phosphate-dependent enzyme [Xanthomonadales bacterium]|nr:L-allo-threonine aldolase [Xanthomonadales bacterium]MCC6591797.1 aminotransferase class I/II-fold pyridoxal phosphate-dependent enzyme [Xanthomonadales bacterium]MCE7930214.1 aminotransferase class I/II-fold pyridoxal phosphate-dependent enzyme [Xanthomonadales bacterium PRO6]